MSSPEYSYREVVCARCHYAATCVVVSVDDESGDVEPTPYCLDCADDKVAHGGREYPLAAFYYEDDDVHVSQTGHGNSMQLFESGSGASEDAWLDAHNRTYGQYSYVDLEDNA